MKISELASQGFVENLECFITSISQRETKKKDAFITVTFKDETGEISGNIWKTTRNSFGFSPDCVVKVSGGIEEYGGNLQLNIQSVVPHQRPLNSFARQGLHDPEELFNYLVDTHIATIHDPFIKFLTEELILNENYAKSYKSAPAAKGVHHPWIGGLLEHVSNLCDLADSAAVIYKFYFPNLDMDKVKFGLLFHDWGKTLEYDYSTPNIKYTKLGVLEHHMGIAVTAITRASIKWEVGKNPNEIRDMREKLHELNHIIYSHHLQPEWGSMVRPATVEALFVHFLDNLDGSMMHAYETIREGTGDLPGMSKKSFIHKSSYVLQEVKR